MGGRVGSPLTLSGLGVGGLGLAGCGCGVFAIVLYSNISRKKPARVDRQPVIKKPNDA